MKRVVTGVLLAVVVVLALKRAPGPVMWLLVLVVALLSVNEIRRILAHLGFEPWPWISFCGTVAILATFVVPAATLAPVLVVLLVLSFVRALVPTQQPAEGMSRLVGTLLPSLYIGLTLGHFGGLFPFGQPDAERVRAGDFALLLVAAVYVGDTFAMYGGRAFGRHKLAPGVSPAKTWEGAAFGVVGAVAASLVVRAWFLPDVPVPHAVALGVVLGVTGILGDLSESLLKRAATLKDSGSLLPGHGGMLDRVDSLLLSAPVVYWYQRLLGG